MRSIWRPEIWEPIWRRVGGVTDAELFGAGGQFVDKAIVDVLVNEQAGGGGAHLALVAENAPELRLDRGVEIGVGEDDIGALAAELEAEALQIGDGGVLEQLAGGAMLPVKLILSTSSCSASASPVVGP